MTLTDTSTTPTATLGSLVYRVEGRLGDLYPLGLFPEGIRFHNDFEGTVVAGPFAGGRFFGLDEFLLRPDGVGEITAPEVIDDGRNRISLQVRGLVVPPAGAPAVPLETMLDPGYEPPDADLRVTAAAMIRTASTDHAHLNGTIAVVEGTVNLNTGRLVVEARSVDRRI